MVLTSPFLMQDSPKGIFLQLGGVFLSVPKDLLLGILFCSFGTYNSVCVMLLYCDFQIERE